MYRAGFLSGCCAIAIEKVFSFEEISVEYTGQPASAAELIEQSGLRVECPGCGSHHPHRLERRGFLQKKILPLFGYYPWLCGVCKNSFLIRKRYRRKLKQKEFAD